MGTESFVGRVRSRFFASPPVMTPRAPLISSRAKSFSRMSDFSDEKADIEDGRSVSDGASTSSSWSIIPDFPKVPQAVPARPHRSKLSFSFSEVERAIDSRFYHTHGQSQTSLHLTPQPQAPIIVTPSPRSRSDPDAPRSAVPSTMSSTRHSSHSSFWSPGRSPLPRVLKAKPSDDSSSFFDTCSILSSSNFVSDSAQVGGRTNRRT